MRGIRVTLLLLLESSVHVSVWGVQWMRSTGQQQMAPLRSRWEGEYEHADRRAVMPSDHVLWPRKLMGSGERIAASEPTAVQGVSKVAAALHHATPGVHRCMRYAIAQHDEGAIAEAKRGEGARTINYAWCGRQKRCQAR